MLPQSGEAHAESAIWAISWSLNRSGDTDELSRDFETKEDGVVDATADPAGRLPGILNPATISRSGVTAVGTNGAKGSFTTGGSQNRTVNWTITDLG